MAYERDNAMTCEEAQVISFRYMNGDPTLTAQQRDGFETHLLICSGCTAEYEENKWLAGLLKKHCSISVDTKKLLQAAGREAVVPEISRDYGKPCRPMTIEESWERLNQSCPSLAEACRRDERKRKLRSVVWHIGSVAAAACILVAIGIGWLAMNRGESGQSQLGAVTTDGSSAAVAERITPEGRKPLALNHSITTGDQPQEILLGGMHRVVMNRNTSAIFSVTSANTEGPHAGKIPYEIQLASGELYVEVVPGNPFTVKTGNARLDITGTKFDVVADDDKTELTLLKGSIRFSALDHQQEAVSVTAGYASTIAGRYAPTAPAPVDALAATIWARDTAFSNAVALADGQANPDLSSLSVRSQEFWRHADLPDVDKLDYETWLKDHQQPPFFSTTLAAMQKAQAIKADWIELLMISGDIWQFHYDPKLPVDQPLAKVEPAAITRLARHYGLDEREVLQMLGLPNSALTTTSSIPGGALGREYADALCRWHDTVMTAVSTQDNPKANDGLKMFSLDASQHLAKTRIAAYLWVKNHPDKARQLLTDSSYLALLPTPPASASDGALDVNEWLNHLHDQANAARICVPAAMEWLTVPPGIGCAYQATEQQRRLAALVAELLPSLHEREGKE